MSLHEIMQMCDKKGSREPKWLCDRAQDIRLMDLTQDESSESSYEEALNSVDLTRAQVDSPLSNVISLDRTQVCAIFQASTKSRGVTLRHFVFGGDFW